ncbi:PucR family transcriptional regulator [Actinomadura opuntiae]|uniref:PucR family transcriptional regulator n=1 Tax=Actinomadura sp. OS1-43 TaxID=604315 RepID=UPI00255A807E|nr:helix-turn-helix domain-containing protein [Actinomadura sp. OS1-43]MDL4820061.1 helix-turn-helix domain-containing protein [Actinomadura sp. OS1-43]
MDFSAEARTLANRCEPLINDLARKITEVGFRDIPAYQSLPRDMREVEIAATVRHGLRFFLQTVNGERVPDPYRFYRERAAQRAEEGMPLHVLLRSYLTNRDMLWRALREVARPGEESALLELADLLFATQAALVGDVTETYTAEKTSRTHELRERQRSLIADLLTGTPAAPGQVDSLGLTGQIMVVVAPPRAHTTAVDTHRAARRLQTALERATGHRAIVHTDHHATHLLLALPGKPPGDPASTVHRVLTEEHGAPSRAARATAPGVMDIHRAATTAREVLRLVTLLDRAPGLYRLDDVLLEYHLNHPDDTGPLLRSLLTPVTADPALAETLRLYISHQQDRRAVARILGLHPNTVDNRIRRIGQHLGTDLTSPYGYALALAALTA